MNLAKTLEDDSATGARPAVLHVLRAGWASSVPVVVLATLAVLLAPHVRGIGFFPVLRYAVVTPVCLLVAVASAFLYRALVGSSRPRVLLTAALVGLALVVLAGMATGGPPGLAAAAFPALLGGAVALSLLVPRFVDRPRRSRIGTTALIVLGALELMGVALALSSERASPSDIPRTMFDADSRFITLPSGARIHYVDEGEGETLLFLHGNPAWSFQWRDLIKGLRGSYRCIALDYPGFGLSEAPAGFGFTPREQSLVVEEFVERLQLRDVTLVMQDWGGPIGLGFAGRRPELVRQVVLGSTWAWPTDSGTPRGIFSAIAGGPLGEFLQVNFNGFAAFGIKNGVVRELPSDVLGVYLRPFVPLERRGIAAFYPGQITAATGYFAEVEAGLPRLAQKKALIFWALQDQGFPHTELERFEQTFPNHRTLELPNANHFFFEDTAEQLVSELRAFMAEKP
ncbi:alpha/beta fold hydrolase [Corallococcus llansteffanensis]|uniref:Alpha/beta fold hydrolase n=1 Tax=Corallococcus llansteffanensis TaxID=2316731 RepID=A0A3A8QGF0_9BACT|nr:alpha/beta fold hydrolase [Corallococcus llansteffanensis]RKH67707.1 alpha/beta fold hydrolase [Corallococcus llansteffanensis]